ASGPNNDLIDLLTKQPKLTNLAKQDFPRTIQALQKGQPVVNYIRPYSPELTGWLTRYAESASPYDGNGHYARVEPIFNKFTFSRLVPGEDVKIAGAKVGKVDSLDVTPDKKAAVVLNISKDGFAPFHANAHCTIRPQSLIGETFADCTPGTFNQPELPTIKDGEPGAGQHLLTVDHTSSPVDIDEINDIYREPIQQRLAIVLNEFGAGLAGRGQDLNDVIHRANPALRETDKVLAILA